MFVIVVAFSGLSYAKSDNYQFNELGKVLKQDLILGGWVGTIIGLVIATEGNLDSSLQTSQIVAGLKEGLNTAFYTTVCGIVFSLPLQVQLMILKFKLDSKNEK